MTADFVDVNAEIDRLYQLPLDEFTAARNALAARLKHAGNEAAAATVRGFSKPSLSAWIVNQLYWRARSPFDRLIAAGDRLRALQQQMLAGAGGGGLSEATTARQQAVNALLKEAARLGESAGVALTVPIRQRVLSTLEALASHGTGPDRPAAGRLGEDVAAPGLSVLASLAAAVPAGQRPSPRPQPKANARTGERRREADRVARRDAAQALKAAEKDVDQRKQAVRLAARAESAAHRAKSLVEARVARSRDAADEAQRALSTALDAAERAAETLTAAERASSAAEQALREAEWRLRQAQTAIQRLRHPS